MSRARTFYESLLEVKLERLPGPTMPDGTSPELWTFPSNPEKWGCSGALVKVSGMPVAKGGLGTLIYFGSDDCSVEAGKVEALGGLELPRLVTDGD